MSTSPLRLLVADDHPLYRSSIEQLARLDEGLEIVALTSDGPETLAAIRELRPDVAIVDVNMPGVDGISMLDALSEDDLPTRVIILSGQLETDQVYRAVELGAAGVLSKLVQPKQLIRAVHDVAAGSTVLAEEVQATLAGAVRARRQDERPALTDREQQILELIAEGSSVAVIAEAMHLSPSTVKSHLENLYRKLGVSERAAAVAAAMRAGVLK